MVKLSYILHTHASLAKCHIGIIRIPNYYFNLNREKNDRIVYNKSAKPT